MRTTIIKAEDVPGVVVQTVVMPGVFHFTTDPGSGLLYLDDQFVAKFSKPHRDAMESLLRELDTYKDTLEMVKKIARSNKHKDPLADIECEVNRAYRLAGHNGKLTDAAPKNQEP